MVLYLKTKTDIDPLKQIEKNKTNYNYILILNFFLFVHVTIDQNAKY